MRQKNIEINDMLNEPVIYEEDLERLKVSNVVSHWKKTKYDKVRIYFANGVKIFLPDTDNIILEGVRLETDDFSNLSCQNSILDILDKDSIELLNDVKSHLNKIKPIWEWLQDYLSDEEIVKIIKLKKEIDTIDKIKSKYKLEELQWSLTPKKIKVKVR